MAKAAVPKKKKKDDDDEDAAPKKKRRAAPEPEDEDEDAEEEDDDSDDSDSDDDSDDDAADSSDDDEDDDDDGGDSDDDDDSDDSDSDDDDDEADSDDDDDDDDSGDDDDEGDDDDDSSDDDEDDVDTPKKAKGSKASGKGISWDTDDAESGGLPEGRVVLLNPRTRLASTADYTQDDPDGAPMLSFDCVPSGKGWDDEALPFEIHLSAGSSARMIPNDDGTDFIPNPEAKKLAKGLNKSTNAFYFVKSLEDAGFPKKKVRLKGTPAFDGLVVELTRVPQPVRKFQADPEGGGRDKTMPSVSAIYSFPWEDKGQKERDRARATMSKKAGKRGKNKLKGKVKGKAKVGSSKKGAAKGSPKGERGAPLATKPIAIRSVLSVLKSTPYAKKGLPVADLYPAVFQIVKTSKNRAEIMELMKKKPFYSSPNRPWDFDSDREILTLRKR